jgi:uncharacterized membrane protein YcaP (DUF421 family)
MDLVLRSVALFAFLYALTRLIGRRELSGLEPFDLILLVVIGDLVQQGITQSDDSVLGALIVVSTLGLMTVLVSFLSYRFRALRPLLEGRPLLLVENGVPIAENMKRERLTIEELEAAARLQNLVSLADVRWAILETSGQISFVPREPSSGSQ